MKREYEYGFIDGSILLVRNFHAMKPLLSRKDVGPEVLVKSVLQSIFKLAREKLQCERYFILWDKKPYHKTSFLVQDTGKSEYKTNRAQESEYLVKKMGEAKLIIMKIGDKLGLTSVQFDGWEADDLAYLAALQCENRSKRSVLISYDSDWRSWIRPNVDYYNLMHNSVYKYESVIKLYPPIDGLTLFESKCYRDSLRGSHNNLKPTVKSKYSHLRSAELIKMYRDGDYHCFENLELFRSQLRTFDMTTYPEYELTSKFLESHSKRGWVSSIEGFHSLLKEYKLVDSNAISDWVYSSYRRSLNLMKWKRDESTD